MSDETPLTQADAKKVVALSHTNDRRSKWVIRGLTLTLLLALVTIVVLLVRNGETTGAIRTEATGLCRAIDTSRTSGNTIHRAQRDISQLEGELLVQAGEQAHNTEFATTIKRLGAAEKLYSRLIVVTPPINCARLTAHPQTYVSPLPHTIGAKPQKS